MAYQPTVLISLILSLLVEGSKAAYCAYYGRSYSYYTYCPSSSSYYYYGGYYYYGWTLAGGAIAGIVIGSIVFIGVIIALIVICCVKGASRSRASRGTVIQPQGGPTVVTTTNTSQSYPMTYPQGPPAYGQPMHAGYPPPVAQPVSAYPPPPAYNNATGPK